MRVKWPSGVLPRGPHAWVSICGGASLGPVPLFPWILGAYVSQCGPTSLQRLFFEDLRVLLHNPVHSHSHLHGHSGSECRASSGRENTIPSPRARKNRGRAKRGPKILVYIYIYIYMDIYIYIYPVAAAYSATVLLSCWCRAQCHRDQLFRTVTSSSHFVRFGGSGARWSSYFEHSAQWHRSRFEQPF